MRQLTSFNRISRMSRVRLQHPGVSGCLSNEATHRLTTLRLNRRRGTPAPLAACRRTDTLSDSLQTTQIRDLVSRIEGIVRLPFASPGIPAPLARPYLWR